jgi:hypothetical protein
LVSMPPMPRWAVALEAAERALPSRDSFNAHGDAHAAADAERGEAPA